MNHSIVPVHLAVKAMRDNGYKNAAHALAELMDNSIQAGAKNVELLCAEQVVQNPQRVRRRINKIAVLDDACGMNSETLRMALQFGNGTRLEESKWDGIGRFGMGLPASSVSQCLRVEVWSWQDGAENALYTYLDLGDIVEQRMSEVPNPIRKVPPQVWRDSGQAWGRSGTLVVWSDLDRLMWKTALALVDNTEFVIGRMYRRFIGSDQVKIRLVAFDENRPQNRTLERVARPNDPGYQMVGTTTPAPWDDTPLFEPYGDVVTHTVHFEGKDYPVHLRYSTAKAAARTGHNPGGRDYGKHAAKNTGVSVVRAGRELELDDTWASTSDPRDRWWGIEVEFPPALDVIFGVTNNKQHAHHLAHFAGLSIDEMLSGSSLSEFRDQLIADADPRGPLVEIAYQIQKTRGLLRRLIEDQTRGEERQSRRRHEGSPAEQRGTEVTNQRKEEGHEGLSDAGESLPAIERAAEIEGALANDGVPSERARELAARTIDDGLKFIFVEASLENSAFFSVKQRGGSIIITLNTTHPAYGSLVEVLEKTPGQDDAEGLHQRLLKAADGLKLLLMAWARYEDEQPDGPRRERAQQARDDWGRLARQFLRESE